MAWKIDALQKAREVVRRKAPYFTSGIYRLQPVRRDGLGTLAVDDSNRLYYDPQALSNEPLSEVSAMLVHELLHLLDRHSNRAQVMNVNTAEKAALWNVAADVALYQLMRAGGWSIKNHLRPSHFKLPANKTVEFYYQELQQLDEPPGPQDAPQPGKGRSGSCASGRQEPWEDEPTGSHDDQQVQRDLLRQMIAQAMELYQRAAGQMPGAYQRLFEDLLERPSIPWQRVLAGMVRGGLIVSGKRDFSRQRPSRRQQVTPDILRPALVQELPRVAVVIDTSGSMQDDDLTQALVEVKGIMRLLVGRDTVTVIACDSSAEPVQAVWKAEQVVLAGGGGTDMGPGLSAAAKLRQAPSVVVVITDGYVCAGWPAQNPVGCPVIVLLVGAHAGLESVPTWARGLTIDSERDE